MAISSHVKVADQVWIALALLTREQPDRDGFSAKEIIAKVGQEFGRVSAGVTTHVSQHCVASKAPSPGRYRMITRNENGRLCLFREGDPHHPDRKGGKIRPEYDDVPKQYHELLEWYDVEYALRLKPFTREAYERWLELAEFASHQRGPGYTDATDVSERVDDYLVDAWLNRSTRIDNPSSSAQ